MAVVANLDVVLRAVTRQFDKKMSGALRSIKGFAGGALAAVGATASLTGAVGALSDSMDRLDALGKASDKLGVATKELQGLRLAAAEFSGFGARQFDTALQRMTRRIAEAAAGMGEAQGAIKELGLNAVELNKSGPAEAFRRISDAMSGVGNSSTQLRLAFKLFDSEGAGLVSTLTAGRGALQNTARFLSDIGIALDDKAVNAVERANDGFGRLKTVFLGTVDVISAKMAPAFERWANALLGMIPNITKLVDGLGKIASFGGFGLIGKLLSGGGDLPALTSASTPGEDIDKIADAAARAAEETKAWNKANEELAEKIAKRNARLQSMAEKLRSELTPPLTAWQTFLQQVSQLNSLFEQGTINLKERNKLLGFAQGKFIDARNEKIAERREKIEERIARLKRFGSKIASGITRLRGDGAATGPLGPAAQTRGTQEAFASFLQNQRNANEGLKNEVLLERQLKQLQAIVREIRKLEAFKPAPSPA